MRSERNEAVSQERVVSERTAEIAISTVGTQRKAEIHKADRPTQPGNISDQNAVKTQRLPAG